jgi:hypothetical protein
VVGVVREAGTHWSVGATASALSLGATAATPLAVMTKILLGPGVITYTGSVGVNPGSAQWYLNYLPLDPGVSVVAN